MGFNKKMPFCSKACQHGISQTLVAVFLDLLKVHVWVGIAAVLLKGVWARAGSRLATRADTIVIVGRICSRIISIPSLFDIRFMRLVQIVEASWLFQLFGSKADITCDWTFVADQRATSTL